MGIGNVVVVSAPLQPAVIQSTQGATGIVFSAPQGVPGPPGSQGSATVAIGTVATGAAGSAATVTNSGTTTAAILNFSIPQGYAGAAGATGATGASVQTATLTHTFSAAGTFDYVHNLNCLYPAITVYVDSGDQVYTMSVVNANTVAITANGAAVITAVFVQSTASVTV